MKDLCQGLNPHVIKDTCFTWQIIISNESSHLTYVKSQTTQNRYKW